MPRYDYTCKNCNKDFFIICSISDNRDNIECDHCKSKNISRIFNATILKTKKEEKKEINSNQESIKKHNHNHEHVFGSHCCPEDEYL